MLKRCFEICLMLGLLLGSTSAHAKWITSWTAAPQPPSEAIGPLPATPSFENQTLRQILRVSAGGDSIRIRLTNAYGEAPLTIGAARIAILDAVGNEMPQSSHLVTFDGKESVKIPAGAPLLSDPVQMKLPPLSKVAISLFLPEKTGPCTCHATGLDRLEISAAGNHVAAPFTPQDVVFMRAFLAAVEVDTSEEAATLAVLGDSISDGVGSTAEADRRWPDLLAQRLVNRGGKVWGVANQGISGNRILHGGMGDSALSRLDRDILALPGIEALIVFEGVNDLGIGFANMDAGQPDIFAAMGGRDITAQQIIEGYRQIIERAHSRGVKVYGATIAPYKGATYWSQQGEAARAEINEWIRNSGEFDAVFDFAAVFAAADDPQVMAEGLHMGDFLHGTDAGYRKVAESINLELFD